MDSRVYNYPCAKGAGVIEFLIGFAKGVLLAVGLLIAAVILYAQFRALFH